MASDPVSDTVSIYDEKTQFQYLVWDDIYQTIKPFRDARTNLGEVDREKKHNLSYQKGSEEVVHDIRGSEATFTLDEHGFIYREYLSSLMPNEFSYPERITEVFLPQCETMLKAEVGGADRVVIYDWRLRSNATDLEETHNNRHGLFEGTSQHVHVDQSRASMMRLVQVHFPGQVEYILSGRVQMLNIWRPINGPVQDRPLAVCDGKSIHVSQLVEVDILRDHHIGRVRYPLYTSDMIWYYMSGQRDDEILFFKSYDTKEDVVNCTVQAVLSRNLVMV